MGESSCGALPIIIRGIHLVNEPVWYQVLMKMVAPFLTDGESVTQIHGSNLQSLHRMIDPSVLPREVGGLRGPIVLDMKVQEEFYDRDDEIFEASRFGFVNNKCKHDCSPSKTVETKGRLKDLPSASGNSASGCR
ncbi:alpha-tocopherol transfer protein-like [Tropilaelaps mercedesae]|uniref:Alpha-tocopherol transfer protein-like n=1 Tax=Tropilaelaps mercedesae TaxID=418985 RepID=A0A1V9XH23_9ACAR|nr:alpha-tocopherol transfer protein-like [Tropilaelaps mercedesae]